MGSGSFHSRDTIHSNGLKENKLVGVELHTHWLIEPKKERKKKNSQVVPAPDLTASSLLDLVFLHFRQCSPLFQLHFWAGTLHLVNLQSFRLTVFTVASGGRWRWPPVRPGSTRSCGCALTTWPPQNGECRVRMWSGVSQGSPSTGLISSPMWQKCLWPVRPDLGRADGK